MTLNSLNSGSPTISSLPPPDQALLDAARQALGSLQPDMAAACLLKLDPSSQCHPDILEVRWEISAQNGDWPTALALAVQRCALPDAPPEASLCHACSLAELGRLPEAIQVLQTAHQQFPTAPAIPYNLACCSCKTRNLDEAKRWIDLAIRLGGRAEIKLMALDEPDLAPLLDYVCFL